MKRQWFQSKRKKAPDTYLSNNRKTNLFFCVTVDPSDTNEGKIYSDICGRFPTMPNKGNKYRYMS